MLHMNAFSFEYPSVFFRLLRKKPKSGLTAFRLMKPKRTPSDKARPARNKGAVQ